MIRCLQDTPDAVPSTSVRNVVLVFVKHVHSVTNQLIGRLVREYPLFRRLGNERIGVIDSHGETHISTSRADTPREVSGPM